MKELEKVYDPSLFEKRIYKIWKEGGYFKANNNSGKKTYSMVMPPQMLQEFYTSGMH